MDKKTRSTVALFSKLSAGCAALTVLVGCDPATTSLRSEQSTGKIWLSAARPIADASSQADASTAGSAFGLAAQATPTPAAIMALPSAKVCLGVRYRDGNGEEQTGTKDCSLTTCAASGDTGCQVTGTMKAIDISTIDFAKVAVGGNIAGRAGSFDASDAQYRSCAATGDKDCTATGQYFAVAGNLLNEGTLKNGTTLGSLTGKYPSTAYPLGAAPAGKKALLAATFTDALKDAGSQYSYYRYDGVVQGFSPDADLSAANIITGKTVYGIGGSSPAPTARQCQNSMDKDCFLPAGGSYVAVNKTDLTPGVIKKGQTIAGVTGTYPSAATPMALGAGRVDFNSSMIASSTAFTLFTKAGDRVEVAGSSDLADPSNIRQGITIFAITGTAKAYDFSTIKPIDVRQGVAIPNTALHGALALSGNCSSAADCIGTGKPWLDVSRTVGEESSDCASGLSHCVYRNQTQQLDWAFRLADPKKNWAEAVTYCKDLSLSGGGWRLPSQKEIQIAAAQHLDKLGHYGFYQGTVDVNLGYWTSTIQYNKNSSAQTPAKDSKASYKRFNNLVWSYQKDATLEVTCVRKAAP